MASSPIQADQPQAAVIIPARLVSTRLPRKPLQEIEGEPMIVHVWRRAIEARIGPVVVAAAEPEIAWAVEKAGGEAVLTEPSLPSGTDRVRAALAELDPEGQVEHVVNLQGDLPDLDPAAIRAVLRPLTEDGADIGTLVVATDDRRDRESSSVVKAVVSFHDAEERSGRALYFSRADVPYGSGPVMHHVGIYSFTRSALERFCRLPPSRLERRERLEQLRALEDGMWIGVRRIDHAPAGVDTSEDLEAARRRMGRRG